MSLAVVLFLATFGSFAVGLGGMTGCTDTYDCTAKGCPPCETTEAWLIAGWIGQGVLLAAGWRWSSSQRSAAGRARSDWVPWRSDP